MSHPRTGPEHMAEGDRLLARSAAHTDPMSQREYAPELASALATMAQAHYTAALAAATALQHVSYGHLPSEDRKAWIAVCGAEQRPVQVSDLPAAEGNGAQ